MSKLLEIKHRFVDDIPKSIEPGILYVSMGDATAKHKCACGCGYSVVTPISPTDWQLTFDGRTVTLHPSIGNWDYPCQSHYFIRKNRVIWAGHMTKDQIAKGREFDHRAKSAYYVDDTTRLTPPEQHGEDRDGVRQQSWTEKIRRWFS